MMGLPRTTKVQSLSKAGISVVTVSFEDDVDLYFARAQVQQRMQDAMDALPEGIRPMLGPAATAMGEVFQYLVESDSVSLIELKNIQEYTIKPLLRTVPGVAEIVAWGGLAQEFQVQVDPHRLASYGLTLRRRPADGGREQRQFRRRLHRNPGRTADGPRTRPGRQRDRHREHHGRDQPGGTPILVRDVRACRYWTDAARRRGLAGRPRRGSVRQSDHAQRLERHATSSARSKSG